MLLQEMTDAGTRDLCAAIITQAVDDYDKLIYAYYKNAQDPKTKLLIPFNEFDYIKVIKNGKSKKQEDIEISKIDKFMDSDWFALVIAPVGGYHPDQIRKIRRKIIGRQAIKDGVIKKRKLFEVFKLNGWDELPF